MSKSADARAKREVAEKRQAERDKRSPKEQIEHLDAMLGVGVGANRERARLAKMIEEVNKPKE